MKKFIKINLVWNTNRTGIQIIESETGMYNLIFSPTLGYIPLPLKGKKARWSPSSPTHYLYFEK